ncbi:hypothetical protein E4T56_gene6422 [Termitomyces sp. T112]|nr:hypothetical protein E4T56_gene6422 [Termitomyces sp. T112]
MAGESQESTQLLIPRSEEPKSLWELLTRRLLIIATNYGLLALLDIALRTLQPVIFSTPIALGGLGLVPLSIGKVLSMIGTKKNIHNRAFDDRSRDCCLPANELRGENAGDWTVALAHLFPTSPLYPRDLIFIWCCTNLCTGFYSEQSFARRDKELRSARQRASLGATKSFARRDKELRSARQMASASFTRAIGPALFNFLFAFSIEHRYMNGNLNYSLLAFILCGASISALLLSETEDVSSQD